MDPEEINPSVTSDVGNAGEYVIDPTGNGLGNVLLDIQRRTETFNTLRVLGGER